jgi:hypothetical protein
VPLYRLPPDISLAGFVLFAGVKGAAVTVLVWYFFVWPFFWIEVLNEKFA